MLDRLLKKYSLRPYMIITLDTGVIVKHYKNKKIDVVCKS